ncbi:MAG: flavodoxin reductase [Spirosoma sp.]|nr:flavodoxin reductase [Spirosoma sp.]
MEYVVQIESIKPVTHNVRCIRLPKPANYTFVPGQATDVAINRPSWKDQKRPFTFTSLNDDDYLEFTIKCYDDHDGVTHQMGLLHEGDELIIEEPWGAIAYKGEGYFIAGGAGITPFMAILRQLHKDNRLGNNKLFFANRTSTDIIYEQELQAYLGKNVIFIITRQDAGTYLKGYLDEEFLETYVQTFDKCFYLCGPDQMIQRIACVLSQHGADPQSVLFET